MNLFWKIKQPLLEAHPVKYIEYTVLFQPQKVTRLKFVPARQYWAILKQHLVKFCLINQDLAIFEHCATVSRSTDQFVIVPTYKRTLHWFTLKLIYFLSLLNIQFYLQQIYYFN